MIYTVFHNPYKMANKKVNVVIFNDEQGWETTVSIANSEDLCLRPDIPGGLDYHCHCWSWKLRTWDDVALKECVKHSGFTDSDDPIERYKVESLIDGGGNWGAFYDDGTCYDLCWLNTREAKAEIATQASIAKEAEANDIDKIEAFDKTLRPELVKQSQEDFIEILAAINAGKEQLFEINNNISVFRTSANRFEREPLYIGYRNIVRQHEENLLQERGRLREQGLSESVIDNIKEIIELINILEKAKSNLSTWMERIGRRKINEKLAIEIAKRDTILVQVQSTEVNIKRDAEIRFYDVLEGYINAKDHPSLRKKYREYLEVYTPYINKKVWGKAYANQHRRKEANEASRKAMSTDKLASQVNMRSVINMSNLLVTESGSVVNTTGNVGIISGGSTLGLDFLSKPSTPERKMEQAPPRAKGGFVPSYKGGFARGGGIVGSQTPELPMAGGGPKKFQTSESPMRGNTPPQRLESDTNRSRGNIQRLEFPVIDGGSSPSLPVIGSNRGRGGGNRGRSESSPLELPTVQGDTSLLPVMNRGSNRGRGGVNRGRSEVPVMRGHQEASPLELPVVQGDTRTELPVIQGRGGFTPSYRGRGRGGYK